MWARGFLSVFLVFHLLCVIIAPNKETYLGYRVAWLIEPYINSLGLSSSWSFFAPDPGPPPVFVEWELLDKASHPLERGRWPEATDPFILRERQNRRIATARFMVFSDERTEQVMLPYLCRTHPQADAVRLWRVSLTIPSLTDVRSGRRKIGDNGGREKRWVSHSFCGGRK